MASVISRRAADVAKDQSYVLYMLDQDQLGRLLLPVGGFDKSEVRKLATDLGLRTAAKADSQDVCFITKTSGRQNFLEARMPMHPGRIVDADNVEIGSVEAVEMVTLGQRKGLGVSGTTTPRYVTDVDVAERTVTVGPRSDLLVDRTRGERAVWADGPRDGAWAVQCSAHGEAMPAHVTVTGSEVVVDWGKPHMRVAPGQSIVFYDSDRVLGGAVAT